MPEFPTQVRTQFIDFVRRLSLAQRLALGAVTIGAIVGIVALVTIVNRPTYGTLFSNLTPQDASKIVEKLQEKKIQYQLEDDGKTIAIPKDKIYDTRLALAGEGLPQSSIIGYEIFDRTNLGVSDFVQKINYRRALEGEIARTILQLQEVEGARVHIVVPEKALFKEDEKPTTASIVLKLRSGKALRRESVQGMIHLVASSVEGLDPTNVTIVDARGTLLSETEKPNSLAAKTSSQYELQQKVENYLATKAQNMLEGVLGAGNARVQVTAELDFRQVERTLEQYDPEKTAVRSEQVTEEKTVVKDSVSPSTRNNTVTNYEVNKTLEHVIESVGGVKRLSVAALVNGKKIEVQKDGKTVTEYQSRPAEEMNQLSEIVRRAVGFDQRRNDEVSVVNLPFGNEDTEGFLYKDQPGTDFVSILQEEVYGKILILVAMLGGVAMLWVLLGRVRSANREDEALSKRLDVVVDDATTRELAAGTAPAELHEAKQHYLPPAESLISTAAKIRAERQTRISEYISNKPQQAGRLLKVWLADS
ncbi:MAG: flagellar M-ring protein FliF [Ignavibacteriae bacterium]|nr:flagellar M-ring protein FliF [Ignavibacteriota bacterium]